jgi:short-subunit dehydrogenase
VNLTYLSWIYYFGYEFTNRHKEMMFMKTALITGASSGIGLEMSYRFAEDGYQMVLVSRNRNTLEQISMEIGQKYHVPVHVIDADLINYDAPQEVYERVTALGVHIDVLVNNAGFGLYGPFLDNDRLEELQMIDLNIRALTNFTKLFLPHMIKQRSGGIINVASTAAFQPGPLFAVYSATKAYVLSFTEALANEMQGTGITVTAFCPGPTATAFMDRSNLKVSKLLRMGLMDVKKAVDIGYKGFNQRRIIVIPGLKNRVLSVLNRFIPRQWLINVTRSMSERE